MSLGLMRQSYKLKTKLTSKSKLSLTKALTNVSKFSSVQQWTLQRKLKYRNFPMPKD